MPVWVMIHRLIDKTFWVSVAFGVLASAASAVGFILKVLMCSHPEASLLLDFRLSKRARRTEIECYCLLLLPA